MVIREVGEALKLVSFTEIFGKVGVKQHWLTSEMTSATKN